MRSVNLPRCDRKNCLNCKIPQCIHDIEDIQSKTYVLAVNNFKAEIFKNTADGAKWLLDKKLSNGKLKNLSGQIRNLINRCIKKNNISWYRIDENTTKYSNFKYALDDKIIFTFWDKDKNAWRIVKKKIGEKVVVPITEEVYNSSVVAQIVLDNYADEHNIRIVG